MNLIQKRQFIKGFATHYLANSWNNGNGFAINVKYHKLGLTSAQQDKFFEIISDENLADEYFDDVRMCIEDWQENHKQQLGFTTKIENKRCRLPMNDPRREQGQTHEWRDVEVTHYKQNAFFAGRSGGWLVLGEWNGYNFCSSDAPRAYDWDDAEDATQDVVEYYYNVLTAFNELFEDLKGITKSFCTREVIEEEVQIPKTVKRFKEA